MRLLKDPPGIRVVPRVSIDARDEAMQTVVRARAEAAALLAEARAQASAVREEARREGVEAARVEAVAMQVRERARQAADASGTEAQVIGIAMEVARAVLGREAASGHDVVRDVTQRALSRMRRARRIVLRVHPDEVDPARDAMRSWLPAGLEPDVLDVEADATVDRGGVVIDSDVGRLDARLATQLEAIHRVMSSPCAGGIT